MLTLFQFAPTGNVPGLGPCWLKAETALRISRSGSAGTHAPAFRVQANGQRLRARFCS